jgi:epoxide hydrolase
VAWARELTEYWRDSYDWRAAEARLNAYPQFVTEIDGQDIHFLRIESPEPGAISLILTHGWPGSVVEFLNVIGPLTDPRAHGKDPSVASDLVIPSLPGFAFSAPLKDQGWGTERTAAAWATLMHRLGYERYGAADNDAGSMISPEVGRLEPEHVIAVHVTQAFSFPSGDPAEFDGMSAEDRAAMQKLQWFMDHMISFNQLQSQQPQTLTHALADSPAGLLGWNTQLMTPTRWATSNSTNVR